MMELVLQKLLTGFVESVLINLLASKGTHCWAYGTIMHGYRTPFCGCTVEPPYSSQHEFLDVYDANEKKPLILQVR